MHSAVWSLLAFFRVLADVLLNSIQLDYFRQFLKMNNAETPLLFWLAVEDIKNDANLRTQRIRINDCVRTYFYNVIPPGRQAGLPFRSTLWEINL